MKGHMSQNYYDLDVEFGPFRPWWRSAPVAHRGSIKVSVGSCSKFGEFPCLETCTMIWWFCPWAATYGTNRNPYHSTIAEDKRKDDFSNNDRLPIRRNADAWRASIIANVPGRFWKKSWQTYEALCRQLFPGYSWSSHPIWQQASNKFATLLPSSTC